MAAVSCQNTFAIGVGRPSPIGRCLETHGAPIALRNGINRRVSLSCSRRQKLFWQVVCSASDFPAAGPDENPYQIFGVSPLEKFDKVKSIYHKMHKEAEARGDATTVAQLEKAYDKIMMSQLSKRKQGLTFGALKISKEIKYADKQPLLSWFPRFSRSSKRDIYINLAISVVMAIWIAFKGSANWKPLQFMIFGHMFQVFNKLKGFGPAASAVSMEEEEDGSRRAWNGKCLLRTIGLVFGCVAVASLAFTGSLNAIELFGMPIPWEYYNSQELFVTLVSSVLLFLLGSFYR